MHVSHRVAEMILRDTLRALLVQYRRDNEFDLDSSDRKALRQLIDSCAPPKDATPGLLRAA